MDYFSATLLFLTWGCLIGGGVYLQLAPGLSIGDRLVLNIALIFTLFAAVFNETLLDRCWRRISIHALKGPTCGAHLRAANFEWLVMLKGVVRWKLSVREFLTSISYMTLRWGTVAAIPIAQLSFEIIPLKNGDFEIKYRPWVVPMAPLAHLLALAIAFILVGLPPWVALQSGYGEDALQRAYQPYLDRVPMGSAASYEDVARHLDNHSDYEALIGEQLATHHRPGRQLRAKLRGMGPGIALIALTLILLVVYIKNSRGTSTASRFYAIQFSYLVENVGYTLALNNIIWQISLESITFRGKSRLGAGTNHLSASSGVMLTIKLFGRCTNCRSKLLMVLFLFQAAAARVLFTQMGFFWNIERSSGSSLYRELISSDGSLLENVGIFWSVLFGPVIFIPFVIFLFVRFSAPLCNVDGWRVAKIQVDGVYVPGRYGVLDGKATMGIDVESFEAGILY